jgi:adenylate cyclase
MSGRNAPDRIEQSPNTRKLVAVMYADMVGYSRLIGLDDAGTLQRLRALRTNLIDPAIEEHGGRIVQTGGDSLLIVFDSIDGAVRCAVKIQQQVPILDGEQPADRAIRFRVGINLGDAIADGTDLHGDAVNVAARLQTECTPGGICVSRSVRDHVHGRLDLAFEDLGVLKLRNIARPVEAFLLRPNAAASMSGSVERALVRGTGEALPLPDKPSIAVLAFANMSGDPEQEYFSDGIADDIITELARSRSLFVIARNSSFSYKGRAVDVRQIARELGVRYVLEGSVRRSGCRVRVIGQLIEAATGNYIWADRYDRALEDVFAVQDEITTAVVTAVQPAVADTELRRILRKPPENLGAWELYQRGLWHMGRCNRADNARAQEFFHRAIAMDTRLDRAAGAMAVSVFMEAASYAARPLPESLEAARIWAQRELEVEPSDADAQAILAMAFQVTGNYEATFERTAVAIRNGPNSFWANAVNGSALIWSGRPVEGRDALLVAERLSPRDPSGALFPTQIAASYYFQREYANAVVAAKRALSQYPDYPLPYRWLAAALGQLGRTDEAREALHRASTVMPQAFTLYVKTCPPWFRPQDHEHMLEGLRKAGWQG